MGGARGRDYSFSSNPSGGRGSFIFPGPFTSSARARRLSQAPRRGWSPARTGLGGLQLRGSHPTLGPPAAGDRDSPRGGAVDAERAGKVIYPGVLIGEGVISGEGSDGGCGSPPRPPSRLGHLCQFPAENWQLKTGERGEKSNKTGPGLEPERHREAQGWVGLAGGHPGVPPLPCHSSPSSVRLRQPRSRLQPY